MPATIKRNNSFLSKRSVGFFLLGMLGGLVAFIGPTNVAELSQTRVIDSFNFYLSLGWPFPVITGLGGLIGGVKFNKWYWAFAGGAISLLLIYLAIYLLFYGFS